MQRGQDPAALGTKLGLVVEGGGMRGTLSCGALIALEHLGLSAVFDEVYSESAGAINACYFPAAQVAFGGRIYLEDLPSLRFINPLRVHKVLDIDFLVDHVMTHVKPLQVDKVFQARAQLFVSVTNAHDGTARVVDVQHEHLSLLLLLKASASIIPLYNHVVMLDGTPYADGGIADPVPIKTAIRRQCTHVLVVLTRPYGFQRARIEGSRDGCYNTCSGNGTRNSSQPSSMGDTASTMRRGVSPLATPRQATTFSSP